MKVERIRNFVVIKRVVEHIKLSIILVPKLEGEQLIFTQPNILLFQQLSLEEYIQCIYPNKLEECIQLHIQQRNNQ